MALRKMSTAGTATLSDVAKYAGVGVSTASAVLRGASSTVRIAEATQRRVQQAAVDLSYRPNAIARSLRTQRTNIIGLYCGYGPMDASNPFAGKIINGLQEECDILRKDLLLHTGFGVHTAEEAYNELANGKIDALVLFTPSNDRLVELLAASSLPAVLIVDAALNLPSIVVDDATGGRLLAEHLADKGHRHVIYRLGIAPAGTSVQRRLASFHEAAAARGMTVVEVTEGDWQGAMSPEEIKQLTRRDKHKPTAVACWHDTSAYGLIGWCQSMGMRVPEDLAVVGFNGTITDASRLCKLTTIRTSWKQVGRTAVQLLDDLMKGKEVTRETVLPVELLVGKTT